MQCTHLKKSILFIVTFILSMTMAHANTTKKPPNFLFFLADDLGWGDIGANGSTFYETPNIDRLCAEGVRFTRAYAAGTVCSPTRSSIVTGRYPVRTGCTQWGGSIRGDEYTLGEALKEGGYSTFFVGKWHVGGVTPEGEGFTAIGKESVEDDPKKSRGMAKATIEFLKENKKRPFFAYVNFHAVHTPVKEREDVVAKYLAKKEANPPQPVTGDLWNFASGKNSKYKFMQDNEVFAAMIEVMDQSIGEVLKTLEEIGEADNTIVIFSSDNGGLYQYTCNFPLRYGKGWVYEGGIRVPTVIKWPGVAKPGTVCDVPFTSTDYFPTMLDIAGLPPRPEDHCDGVSIADLLRTGKAPDRKAMFWHYPHDHGSGSVPSGVVMVGDYKLVHFYRENKFELYNLKDDISETTNLLTTMPEKAEEMKAMLKQWQTSFPDISYDRGGRVGKENKEKEEKKKETKSK